MRGIINFGPGEDVLAQEVVRAAGEPAPVALQMDIPQLLAVLRRARLMIAADSGPLHLAAALGAPALGLYGPTDPARNGPWGAKTRVIRKAEPNETTYKRGDSYSPAMLRITVPEVYWAAVELLEQK
jgi:heptosyltransferase I